MFTGIVERTGKVVSLTTATSTSITQMVVDPGPDFATDLGDSVSVNGCCLTQTVSSPASDRSVSSPASEGRVGDLVFDVGHETLRLTNLSALRVGDEVNLERSATLSTRLGGHLVSGHIDGTTTVTRVDRRADGWTVEFKVPRSLGKYLIAKGSVALDGISLTVASVRDTGNDTLFEVMLIPTTVSITTMKSLAVGRQVNFEADLIGKYVERLVSK